MWSILLRNSTFQCKRMLDDMQLEDSLPKERWTMTTLSNFYKYSNAFLSKIVISKMDRVQLDTCSPPGHLPPSPLASPGTSGYVTRTWWSRPPPPSTPCTSTSACPGPTTSGRNGTKLTKTATWALLLYRCAVSSCSKNSFVID